LKLSKKHKKTGTKFGDSLKDKFSKCDPTIGTSQNPVKVGDAVVTDEAAGTGHVAIINSITKDKNGNDIYTLSESNYKKNSKGVGVYTNTRTLGANSSYIMGYARGNKDLSGDKGPSMPQDNKAAWLVNAPVDSNIKADHIKNGTVDSIIETRDYKDGKIGYKVAVKDLGTNTIHVFDNVISSDLRVGASWSNSEGTPVIGKSGPGGYSQEIKNTDGSPLLPTGKPPSTPLVDSVKSSPTGQSAWGTSDQIPAPGSRNDKIIQDNIKQLEASGRDLETALGDIKRKIPDLKPENYYGLLVGAASKGSLASTQKQVQISRGQEYLEAQHLREARTIVPAAQFSADPSVKNYRTTVSIMPEITSIESRLSAPENNYKTGNAATDLRLLDSYIRMSTGGTVTEAQGALVASNQAAVDEMKNFPQSKEYGGFLTPESRKQIIEMAHSLQDEQKKTFDQVAGSYQSQLEDYFGGRGMKSPIDLTKIADVNKFSGNIVDRNGEVQFISQSDLSSIDAIPAGGTYTDPETGVTYNLSN